MLTHILVANSTEAKLYVNVGPNDSVHTVAEEHYEMPKTHDMVDDQRGREANPSTGAGTHVLQTFESPTDPKTQRRREIADEIADDLHQRQASLKRLVIAAPPQLLGMLRKKLSPQVAGKVYAELDKDLTHEDERTLPQHLADVIALHDPINDFDYEQAKRFTAT